MQTMLLQNIALILLNVVVISAQGPPGVPPRQGNVPQQQQFQQPPNTQQMNQQQFQQQQMNVQEGQAQGHAHGAGGNKLKFQAEIHNADHIIEHLQHVIKTKPKEEMSEEELEFHYFKMHDYDNNNKLDGVEIGKALTHFHDDHGNGSPSHAGGSRKQHTAPQMTDDELEEMIEDILHEDDDNGDGYVDYTEFMVGQRRRRDDGVQGSKPYSADRF